MIELSEFIETVFEGYDAASEAVCLSKALGTGGMMNVAWPRVVRTAAPWYVCISTVRPVDVDGGMLRRRLADLQHVYCIVLDDISDGSSTVKSQQFDSSVVPVQPSWKMETSEGNFQWGYLLEPTSDLGLVTAFVSALASAGMTDPGATGAYRVVRVPGSLHKSGFVARVVEWTPSRWWDLSELITAFGLPVVRSGDGAVGGGASVAGGGALSGGDGSAVADEMLLWLESQGLVKEGGDTGGDAVGIVCPWADEHTGAAGRSDTSYFPYGRGSGEWAARRGFKCLHGHCAGRGYKEFAEWVSGAGGPGGLPGWDPLPWLQGKYVYVVEGRVVCDMSQRVRGGYWKMSVDEWAGLHAGRVRVAGADRPVALRTAFLESSSTVKVSRMRYLPSAGELDVVTVLGQKVLNTYAAPQHMSVSEIEALGGGVSPSAFLRHMEYILPDEAERSRFVQWLAFKVQNPGRRSYAVVMVAEDSYGTGRSWMKTLLGQLFGSVGSASMGDLLGVGKSAQYNDWWVDEQLVVVEETRGTVPDGEFFDAYETLKEMVDTRVVEKHANTKYGGKRVEKIYCNYLMFTNHGDALALPEGDRRVDVMTNPGLRRGADYYAELEAALDGGVEAARLWWYLSEVDVSGFDAVYPPMTDAKRAMFERTQSPMDEVVARMFDTAPGNIVTRRVLKALLMWNVRELDYANIIGDREIEHARKRVWRSLKNLSGHVKNDRRLRIGGRQEDVRALRFPLRYVECSNEVLHAEVKKNTGSVEVRGKSVK